MKSKNKTVGGKETELALRKSFWNRLSKQKALILMAVPFVLYVILFKYVPLWGWTMAFQDYKPAKSFSQQEWVGFRWFITLYIT